MSLAIRVFALVFLIGCGLGRAEDAAPKILDGDILFQSLPRGPLVDAIEGATRSPFSHCGIAHLTPRGWVVIEAIGPVKETPLADWIGQGRGKKYAVFRLKPAYRPQIPAMIKAAKTYLGRPYDVKYELDDEKIYCSELIFKAYGRGGGSALGQLQKLGDLNWKAFEKTITQIEGGPVPLDRLMITPRALSEAPQLERVGNVSR